MTKPLEESTKLGLKLVDHLFTMVVAVLHLSHLALLQENQLSLLEESLLGQVQEVWIFSFSN